LLPNSALLGQITGCSGTFTDSGGAGGGYGSYEDYTVTYCPTDPSTQAIQISFSSFALETPGCYDYLDIYNGANTSASSLGNFCNTNSPGVVTSSDASGCLTFEFYSDVNSEAAGWVASVSCVPSGGGSACNNNGVQDGDETGIDCGGASCPACAPSGCGGVTVGTVSVSGANNTGTDQYELAFGSTANFSATGTVLPTATGPDPAGLTWNIFSCPPQAIYYTNPQNDPCYLGTDYNAITTDANDGAGLSGTYTSVWVLPVTFDDACDDFLDGCFDSAAGPDEYPIITPDGYVAYATRIGLVYFTPRLTRTCH